MTLENSPQPGNPTTAVGQNNQGPLEPVRVKNFARFFKNYMSVSAVVAAALPIPVTSFKLIPTFEAHTPLLSTYTSLFCFLLLAFVFYSRHTLGRAMFPRELNRVYRVRSFMVGIAPAILIVASLGCIYYYHSLLSVSVSKFTLVDHAPDGRSLTADTVLKQIPLWDIPYSEALIFWYLGIFVFAETAFIMMALREYLQDLLNMHEAELIYPPTLDRIVAIDKPELLRAITAYRAVTIDADLSADNFLEWAADERLDSLVNAIAENEDWRREIHRRLPSGPEIKSRKSVKEP